LVLTSPTGGGRSVGIVRSRTKATEFRFISCLFLLCSFAINEMAPWLFCQHIHNDELNWTEKKRFSNLKIIVYIQKAPRPWCLHLIVGTRSFAYADDPKSLASCKVASGKASLVGQVRKRETCRSV